MKLLVVPEVALSYAKNISFTYTLIMNSFQRIGGFLMAEESISMVIYR
jgi:hypothetical protein